MSVADHDRPVLVAIDFSADSETALVWAKQYASLAEAPLVILHVVHDPADAPGFYRREEDNWTESMAVAARRMAEEFIRDVQGRHPELAEVKASDIEFIPGLPPGRIVEFANKIRAQIIVLGSSGRTGLPHILLGSVAERVAQTASVPVVIAKPSADEGDA